MVDDQKFTISQEGLICVSEGHELVAIIRRNGDIVAYGTKKLTFDATAQMLARIAGQPPFKLEKE